MFLFLVKMNAWKLKKEKENQKKKVFLRKKQKRNTEKCLYQPKLHVNEQRKKKINKKKERKTVFIFTFNNFLTTDTTVYISYPGELETASCRQKSKTSKL